jgi:hypothetical protein
MSNVTEAPITGVDLEGWFSQCPFCGETWRETAAIEDLEED